jgi:transposase
LTSKGIHAVIINPLLISNFVKLSLRKTKTDKKDAMAIAQFLLAHKDSLTQHALSPEMSDLRDLARQREGLVDQMTAVKHEIKRLLTITFPELEGVAGLFTTSMLRLLCTYPSAASIRAAGPSNIAEIIIPGSMGKNTEASVQAIQEAAVASVGTASSTKEMIIKQKASLLTYLDEHLQEITNVLIERCQSSMKADMEILRSIPGIGDKTATNFLVEIGGDINKFENHKKLIAMAGIDPSVYQSGKYEGRSKISKRGNRYLRRVIWLMTTKVVMFNDFFRTYFSRRKKEGLPYKKAILATAHKLIRVIFAMQSTKTLFNAKASS